MILLALAEIGGIGAYILWTTIRILIVALPYGFVCQKIAYRFRFIQPVMLDPCQEPMVDITTSRPRGVRETGMSHIPEDRHKMGIILPVLLRRSS